VRNGRYEDAAEAQLRAGLETCRPKANTPYSEINSQFAMDAARALQLASEIERR
jgi:hypothetical protein